MIPEFAALDAARFVVLTDGHFGPDSSKTATSAIRYVPERIAAVVDVRHAGRTVEDVLGFGGGIPVVATLEEGLAHDPTALLIGIAPVGGRVPETWREVLRTALSSGLDVVSGMHELLSEDAELAALARRHGRSIHDLRRTPEVLPVSSGKARQSGALRVLTVGTDCNIGKMTAGLEIRDALEAGGTRVAFAATGQTGILVEGWGIAVDAVKADFIGGAAESLVLHADRDRPDLILVEGQGSIVHPGYSGVTLGLMHGSLPDLMVLCHQPTRSAVFSFSEEYDWVTLPSLPEAVELYEGAMRPIRPARVAAIALMTWDMEETAARAAVRTAERETGLPATDPVRFGAEPIAEALAVRLERRMTRAGG